MEEWPIWQRLAAQLNKLKCPNKLPQKFLQLGKHCLPDKLFRMTPSLLIKCICAKHLYHQAELVNCSRSSCLSLVWIWYLMVCTACALGLHQKQSLGTYLIACSGDMGDGDPRNLWTCTLRRHRKLYWQFYKALASEQEAGTWSHHYAFRLQ